MFGDIIQPTHLLFILVVALVVLGPKRLPEVGRSLGKGIRDFRSAMSGIQDEAHGIFSEPPAPPQPVVTAAAVTQPAASPAATQPAEPDPADYAD